MESNRTMILRASLSCIILVALLVGSSIAGDDHQRIASKRSKLPSILEWSSYMKIYNKSYSSLLQQLARQRIFLARSFEVAIVGIKYKFYQSSFYTSINKFSDLTRDESKAMLSGDLGDKEDEPPMTDAEAREHLLEAILGDQPSKTRDSIEAELRQERAHALRRLRRRRKRSIDSSVKKLGRALSIRNLVKSPQRKSSNGLKVNTNLNIRWLVPSDNPDYDRSSSVADKLMKLKDSLPQLYDIPADKIDSADKEVAAESANSNDGIVSDILNRATSWLSQRAPSFRETSDDPAQPVEGEIDEDNNDSVIIIRDWRDSGCIAPPKNQGLCTSCYALSSMAFVEWAYCMKHEHTLTPLSSQYMVSCGLQYHKETNGAIKLYGCNTGTTKQTMQFVQEYGVELEANMPYVASEAQCPVPVNVPKKRKGYIRPNVKPVVRLAAKTSQLDLALKSGPVIVSMLEPINLLAYAGGMVNRCEPDGGHAMLIVGHGIEDGVEFLIIKNSFGEDWGYDGYFKFKRSSIVGCVKEFIVPMISFPGRQTQARQIRAYHARASSDNYNQDSNNEIEVSAGELFGQRR